MAGTINNFPIPTKGWPDFATHIDLADSDLILTRRSGTTEALTGAGLKNEIEKYDNTVSGLSATNKQDAIDELSASTVDSLSDLSDVNTSGVLDGQALVYDNSQNEFIPTTLVSVPTGTILCFAASGNIPSGYLVCDGSAISRTTYSDLFFICGSTWGSTSTTFNLPDLRGEFVRGWDGGKGTDPSRNFGSFQNYDIQSHNHQISLSKISGSGDTEGSSGRIGTSTTSTTATGGSETRPRNIALNYIIKY
jgi:microcystin-dependent protein